MESKEVNLLLPWPPSVNKLWSTNRRGNWYTTKAAKDFKDIVYYYIHAKQSRKLFNEDDRISLSVKAYPADKRKHDLDNILKVLCDALENAEVFPNDNQIKKIDIEMLKSETKDAYVIVSLKKIA